MHSVLILLKHVRSISLFHSGLVSVYLSFDMQYEGLSAVTKGIFISWELRFLFCQMSGLIMLSVSNIKCRGSTS